MLRKKPKRRQGVPEVHEPRRHGRSRKIEAGELGLEGQAGGAEKYEVLVQHIYYLAISMIPGDAMARRFVGYVQLLIWVYHVLTFVTS